MNAPRLRRGMTLVEMLVATTATLILMGAIAQIFSVFGSAVSGSRSMIELDNRMRSVAWRLRGDLSGSTATTTPPLSPDAGEGYLEIIEGPNTDRILFNPSTGAVFDKFDPSVAALGDGDRLLGDVDDILLFTTRNEETPFQGRYGTTTIESPVAEVAWFLRGTAGTTPTTYTLYRRQLLVLGYAGLPPFQAGGNGVAANTYGSWTRFYDAFDVSVSLAAGMLRPTSLADLTRRETRFLHNHAGLSDGSGFPYPFDPSREGLFFNPAAQAAAPPSTRVSEDVVLTNVIAFDVRVFDPTGPVSAQAATAFVPGDPGFQNAADAGGCYVDLGNGAMINGPAGVPPRFAGFGQNKVGVAPAGVGMVGAPTVRRTWDTWSTHYETNGRDDDGDGTVDQGTDGLDNNANGQVDEPLEQETSAPYPVPLRGIEIRLRCFEPSSRQVRQVTVRHSFVPR